MPSKNKTTKTAASCKPLPLFIRPKPIKVVTKAVLLKIADSIHNPKTGHYLNLCTGTLQNGHDPVCETRSMHCGLGELYFVVTGRQPEEDGACEEDVVKEITARSTVGDYAKQHQKKLDAATKKIRALGLPDDLTYALLEQVEEHDYEKDEKTQFEDVLEKIPDENDIGEETAQDYKARAKRVAAQLREAAAILPR